MSSIRAVVLRLLDIIEQLPDPDRFKAIQMLLLGIFIVIVGGGLLYGFLRVNAV